MISYFNTSGTNKTIFVKFNCLNSRTIAGKSLNSFWRHFATFHDARLGSLRIGHIYTKSLKDEILVCHSYYLQAPVSSEVRSSIFVEFTGSLSVQDMIFNLRCYFHYFQFNILIHDKNILRNILFSFNLYNFINLYKIVNYLSFQK